MKRLRWNSLSAAERAAALRRPAMGGDEAVRAQARDIIDAVRAGGDAALRELAKKFDGAEIGGLEVAEAELDGAIDRIAPEARAAIDAAYTNIRAFHRQQGLKAFETETAPGVSCARRVLPVGAAGLYVPGGSAPLVSTTLMLGVPSQIAGNPLRILCTPCGTDGAVNPHILYAAACCGLRRVFRAGGAQAIAAMAYGTESVPRVDKIFGPGNAWVTAAKDLVAADSGGAARDMPAGPSEVCVVADDSTDPAFAAADLLSQAEHDPLSQVLLISLSEEIAARIEAEAARQLDALPRAAIARQAMANSLSIVAGSHAQALEISNLYAPEHLILCFDRAETWAEEAVNAGSVFVGPWTPESAGDYCSGTNHVLPTYGHARAFSGLGVEAFQKTITVQKITRGGLAGLAPTIATLAGLEGLDAHARAVAVRTEKEQ